MRIEESRLRQLTAEGNTFTKDNPKYPDACAWDTIVMTTASYMGAKLFMASGRVYMSHKIRGMKDSQGNVTVVEVLRG